MGVVRAPEAVVAAVDGLIGGGEKPAYEIGLGEAAPNRAGVTDPPHEVTMSRHAARAPHRSSNAGRAGFGTRPRTDRLGSMLTAFILVKSTREGLTKLGPALADVEGVAEVYTVTGEWDFVAIVRVREHDDLANVVTKQLTRLDGIEKTQTMVAFQQFSAHDLEAMFGLGMEDKPS